MYKKEECTFNSEKITPLGNIRPKNEKVFASNTTLYATPSSMPLPGQLVNATLLFKMFQLFVLSSAEWKFLDSVLSRFSFLQVLFGVWTVVFQKALRLLLLSPIGYDAMKATIKQARVFKV